ncbi:hypothetical protein [Paraburkholderia silvatlantica]|uniref:hypothetical protein n=1 Tax=Paraburkholderia silvatlantica TaxID=321895 RepID=UPI000DA11E70|nr:hypothetical protein [Paraburkholderia silvatlantica]
MYRWLTGQGISNLMVDSASIEVNRRARRLVFTSRHCGVPMIVIDVLARRVPIRAPQMRWDP